MKQGFTSAHWTDSQGNPAGGVSSGTGFTISWQNGPLGRGPDRKEPNGAFVEDVLAAVKERIEFYENSRFACEENEIALKAIILAQKWLDQRTQDREVRQVEGTHLK